MRSINQHIVILFIIYLFLSYCYGFVLSEKYWKDYWVEKELRDFWGLYYKVDNHRHKGEI